MSQIVNILNYVYLFINKYKIGTSNLLTFYYIYIYISIFISHNQFKRTSQRDKQNHRRDTRHLIIIKHWCSEIRCIFDGKGRLMYINQKAKYSFFKNILLTRYRSSPVIIGTWQRNGTNPSTTTKANTTNDGGSKTFLYNLLKKNMVAYINRYVTDYVSDLRQVGGFLRFPPPIKLTATI